MIPHSQPTINRREAERISQVLLSQHIALGDQVHQFEKETARYLNRHNAVAVSSGTAALHLALLGQNIKDGDEVLLPSYVCSALLQAIQYVRAKPVFLDINPDNFEFDSAEIQKKKTRKTKAFILVHSFGYPIDVVPYLKLGIPVIEDVANSLGAKFNGKRVGRMGQFAVTSFYATKMMTTGEGGMILCDSSQKSELVRKWRSYDEKKVRGLAFNYKMTDFQAALGRSQLKQLSTFVQKRKKIAAFYFNQLKKFKKVMLPSISKEAQPCFHRFVFRYPNANWLIRELNNKGISARKPIFKPLHHYFGLKRYPGTELLFKEHVSLPIYPSLTEKQAQKIIKTLKNLIG